MAPKPRTRCRAGPYLAGRGRALALKGMSMYGLHGKMKARPGQRDTLLRLMLDGTDPQDPMPGCYLYVISRADDDPDGLWITEVWRDKEAHDASLSLASVQALIAVARPLIAGFADRSEFTPLGGFGIPAE